MPIRRLLLSVVLASCSQSSQPTPDLSVADDAPRPPDRAPGREAARRDVRPEASPADRATCPSLQGKSFTLRQIDVIGGAPIYPDLDIGADGRPVVVFTKGSASGKWPAVSVLDGQTWSAPETVEKQDSSALGKRPSLLIAADGRLHVTSYDETGMRLHYATRPASSTSWTVELLYQAGVDAGDHSSLAADKSGGLHLTFLEYGTYHLIYGTLSGSTWSFETVQSGGAAVKAASSSLALDDGGREHVAYFTGDRLDYAFRQGGAWTAEPVDSSSAKMGHYPSLALDAAGNPQVVYLDWAGEGAVRFARRVSGSWKAETVDQALGITYTTGHAVHPCGLTLIAYARNEGQGTPGLLLGVQAPGSTDWTKLSVDASTYVSGIDLAIGPDGRIHLVYLDETNYVLRHAELAP
jgi:hypothetical protein